MNYSYDSNPSSRDGGGYYDGVLHTYCDLYIY